MLSLVDDAGRRGLRLCDGIRRRDLLRVGTLSVGGLSLRDLLAAEQATGRRSHKAVIMIYMCGAPAHQDMYDLKMEAPAEIRGEFRPIPTSVPGIEICEHMPRLAAIMDKCVPLRSVYGSPDGNHDSFICYTGRTVRNQPSGGWPSIGAVASRLLGPVDRAVPAFVGLSPDAGHPPYGSPGLPGFLGVSHAAFRPNGPASGDLVLQGMSAERLADRRTLLGQVDRLRRDLDASRTSTAWTPCRAPPSTSSPAAVSPGPSTFPRSRRACASATAKGTRSASATGPRATSSTSSWPAGSSRRAAGW